MQRLSIAASVFRDISNIGARMRDQWDPLRPSNAQSLQTLDTIFAEYQYRMSRDQSDALQYGVAGVILNSAVIVGGAFVPAGTLPAIMNGLGAAGANASISAVIDELKNHGRQQTSQLLENGLTKLLEAGRIADLAGVKDFSPEQRRTWLRQEGLVDEVLARAGDVREEDRPIVEGMLVRALNDRINRSLDIQRNRDRDQDAAIDKQAKQIGAVARTLNEFKETTEKELKDIRTKQDTLNGSVTALANDVARTREDVEFIQRFMFDKMNPTEQLAALEGGIFAGMPAHERARLTAKTQILKQRQDLIEAVSTFSQGAATVARIADRLKVDPNIVSAIQKGAEIANVTQTVLTAFKPGSMGSLAAGMGYLAAADAISGLVFGAGPDPGAQRHAEIMSALGEIKQGIAEIQGMLVAMSQQLDRIMQAQKATYEAIVHVSEQIQANHREVMAELARIRADLVPIAAVVNEQLFKDIEACWTFQARLAAQGYHRSRAISYAVLRSIHREHGRQCLAGLKDILRDPFTSVTHDLRKFKGDPGSPTDRFLEEVYAPTRMFLEHWVFPSHAATYAKSFGMPVTNVGALNLKRAALFGTTPPTYATSLSRRSEPEIVGLLHVALSPQVIARHVGFLSFAHPFFEMDEALEDTSPTRLISLETTSIEGRELLRSALALVEVAIAQQTMLAGDASLAELARVWRDGVRPRAPGESDAAFAQRSRAWSELQGVMAANSALRRNLILYMVSTAVREAGNPLVYGVAHALAGNASYLRNLLPEDQFPLVWRAPATGQPPHADHVTPTQSTGWYLKIVASEYPLPTPLEVSSGELVQTPDLKELLTLKNQLLVELHGYLVTENLSASRREFLRQGIWRVSEHYR
jgi:hypothetical protein